MLPVADTNTAGGQQYAPEAPLEMVASRRTSRGQTMAYRPMVASGRGKRHDEVRVRGQFHHQGNSGQERGSDDQIKESNYSTSDSHNDCSDTSDHDQTHDKDEE